MVYTGEIRRIFKKSYYKDILKTEQLSENIIKI